MHCSAPRPFRPSRISAAALVAGLVLAGCLSQTPGEPPIGGTAQPPQLPRPPQVPEPLPPQPPVQPAATLPAQPPRPGESGAVRNLRAEAPPTGHTEARQAPVMSRDLPAATLRDGHRALPAPDRERYQALVDNPIQQVASAPVSTFSIDVDTGSWSNVRRILNAGRLPPGDAVRVEELINYFPYDDAPPRDGTPFAVHTEVARAPWNDRRLLLRIAIKGADKAVDALPPANLVFLVDVSGSMNSPDKLPLLKSSLKLLADRMRPQDRISLVTYASGTTVALEATSGAEKAKVVNAIDGLRAGGSTAGASGIELAYRVARQAFIPGGINRILLATDGDFNVGVTDFRQLKDLVAQRRASGISLSTLGFGTGNYNEQLMEQLADAGDGAYSYIDTLLEGHKVLVTEMSSTLETIARDVKVQVEFNPAVVSAYRLIGYENRILAREDFNNDRVDAGDVGAGHSVTALYELTPAGEAGAVDPLRYGRPAPAARAAAGASTELAFVRLRYKHPQEDASRLIERPVAAGTLRGLEAGSAELRFATAIAGFGQLLRGGRHTGTWRIGDARALAAGAVGSDRFGYRAEALRLMDLAGALATPTAQPMRPGSIGG